MTVRGSWFRLVGYGVGSLASGIFTTVPAVLLLFYLTERLAIAAGVAAAIILGPKIAAVVLDPLIGRVSDMLRGRLGGRAVFVLIGGLVGTVAFALLFAGPPNGLAGAGAAIWMAVVYAVAVLAYSIFAVPYIALAAEVASDAHGRSRIVTIRMAFVFVGVLLGAAGAPWLVDLAGGGRPGYAVMGLMLAAVGALSVIAAFFAVNGREPGGQGSRAAAVSLPRVVLAVLSDAPFRSLLLAYVLFLAALSMGTAAVPYLAVGRLGLGEGASGLLYLALFGIGLPALPVWSAVGHRIGLYPTLALSGILLAGAQASIVFLHASSPPWALAATFSAIGLAFSAAQVLPFTLLAQHTARLGAANTDNGGLITGVWTAGEKLALALGPSLAGVALALMGFRSGQAASAEQGDAAVLVACAYVPALLALLGTAVVAGQAMREGGLVR